MAELTWIFSLFALLWAFAGALLIPAEGVFHDDDLSTFVTLPDVRAPKFNVTVLDPDRVSPGYWFVAPYTNAAPVQPLENYQPHQIGACIYDGNGDLIWTGAPLFKDRAVFDFRPYRFDGKDYLSFIVNADPWASRGRDGSAMVLDASYRESSTFALPMHTFNMHEFRVVPETSSGLIITTQTLSVPFRQDGPKRAIADNCIEEIDLVTRTKIYRWCALDHLNLTDSNLRQPFVTSTDSWDFVHLNSVEKSMVNGDYIISSRYTDTIYRVSHEDGSIVWRFGGKNSSFAMDPTFRFIAQHDARIVEETNTTVVLSFLNNAADDTRRSERLSSAHIFALDTETWTATRLHSYLRPDNGTTHGRGNFQVLPNRNVFANWAGNGYFTEFAEDGEVVMQANFSSLRYVTYRAYKAEFNAEPLDRPRMKSFASVTAQGQAATEFYVSWNGATRVQAWNFYSCDDQETCKFAILIGTVPRSGFETNFTAPGLYQHVFVEAVDSEGKPLGESDVSSTTVATLSSTFVAPAEPGKLIEFEQHGKTDESEPTGHAVLMQRLLILTFFGTSIAIGWSFIHRRRFKFSLVDAWRDPEKQSLRRSRSVGED